MPARHSKSACAGRFMPVFPVIFTGVFLLHLPLLRLPYFWDEAGYYIPAAYDLFTTGQLIPSSTLDTGHPFLPSLYLAFWWKLSAFSPSATRFAMLLLTAFGLTQLYHLARRLSTTTVAVATVILTALYPVFFAQSSLAHWDTAAAALTLWGLRLYFEEKRTLAALAFSLAVLSKETAILTPIALAFVDLLARLRIAPFWLRSPHRERLEIAWLLAPVVALVAWFGYHFGVTGTVFGGSEYYQYNVAATLNLYRIPLAFIQRLWHLFGHMNMLALTLAGLIAMWFEPLQEADGSMRPRIPVDAQIKFAAIALAHLVAFSILGGALLTRYLLPVYPLVIMVGVSTLRRRVPGWQWVATALGLGFVMALFLNPPYRFAPEDNLAYRDYVLLHQRAAGFIDQKYAGARVLTAWPATDELSKPYLGYVRRGVPVVSVRNFTLDELALAAQAGSDYNLALLFSTKYEPPQMLRLPFWEKWQEKYFDYHRNLPPELAARMLGGKIVMSAARGGQWVAVVEFQREELARR